MTTVTERLVAKLERRRQKGLAEYGVELGDAGLSQAELLVHLQEELLDATAYIEAILEA